MPVGTSSAVLVVIVGPPVPSRDYGRHYQLRAGYVMQAYRKDTMVDAEDRVLREHSPRDAIEFSRGGQITSKRLFDNDARMRGQVRSTEPFDHRLEERGRDSEVVRRAPSTTQRALYRRERLRIIIVPAHVLEQGQKMVEATLAVDTARSFYAFCHALVQTGQAPLREGDADYRDPKGAAFHHRIKRRKNHFVGEIARHPEEYQRVRMGGFHQSSPSFAAGFFSMPPNGLVFFSQRREPPTNAFRLSPMRVSGGRSLMCLAFPPPNTTYSGSSACLRRSTTSATWRRQFFFPSRFRPRTPT